MWDGDWTETDLDTASDITDADIDAARRYWESKYPGPWGPLLDAGWDSHQDEAGAILIFAFLVAAGAYQSMSGTRVGLDKVRSLFDPLTRDMYLDLSRFTAQAVAKGMDAWKWRNEFLRQVKPYWVAAAALGSGGLGTLAPSPLSIAPDTGLKTALPPLLAAGGVNIPPEPLKATTTPLSASQTKLALRQQAMAQLRAQSGFLANFARDMKTGISAGFAGVRAGLYAEAGRSILETTRRGVMVVAGRQEERRIRHISDSCYDCLAWAALDWQPIGTLEPIGASVCRTRCHCTFEYR